MSPHPKNFAVTGVAGFVAPRHLKAIADTGNRLVAAVDPHDAVGLLDRFGFDVRFFTEFERFDRHLEKLRRGAESERVQYLSICSPNYLHDAHIRLALRVGADAICEKPLVINPWNLDALQDLEGETGNRVYTVLQLRLHPALAAFRERLQAAPAKRHSVQLAYLTARGRWYDVSWKGIEERSGGIVVNIGIHFFDLLVWLFGRVERAEVHLREAKRAAGTLTLANADVQWYLSAEVSDLPFTAVPGSKTTFRSITVDGEQLEFSEGFTDLHTRVYEDILAGRGFGIDQARPSIELSHRIRQATLTGALPADQLRAAVMPKATA
ncbi:MAG TPA: Gfo/Idh/MocA family oxidoreductase [Vicinamibacterales bacterium]|nr:Gfo/Idh/MocA family oxidoreductase [Vicinamibacterales bacterium]